MELFSGWYSGTSFELETLRFKLFGFYAPLFWEMIFCCTLRCSLLMLVKRFTSWTWMLVLSLLINLGMITERFIIVATSQPRKFLPDALGFYFPKWPEISIRSDRSRCSRPCSCIFIKWVPCVSLYEVETLRERRRRSDASRGGG